MSEENAYILGTHREELHRLGLQHQVWAEEARRGWRTAGFTAGQALLDLGCGPGFCTQELAYIAGDGGRVIGVDLSEGFIQFAGQVCKLHGFEVELQARSFDEMELPQSALDGAFSRWALAWVPNPEDVIASVARALKPGGVFVVHEYYDWSTFQTEPERPAVRNALAAALASFRASPGDIDVGRRLGELFQQAGLAVIGSRPMSKLATPGTLTWQWPKTFLDNYLPRLVETGSLTADVADAAVEEWAALERTPGATCYCPQMVEVIGCKPG